MTAIGQDTLGTRDMMNVGGKDIAYYSFKKAAAKLGDVSRLPFSMKVLLENLLRFEDGVTVTTADGRGVVYRQRDRDKMFDLLRESLKRQLLLIRRFNRMRKVYRAALPELTSTRRWEEVLVPAGTSASALEQA